MNEKERQSGEQERPEDVLPTVNPDAEKSQPPKASLHPAFYIATWISLSSSVIIFNKWILDTAGFKFPIVLTTWHLAFATLMTQILARTTGVLDSRKKVPMTGKIYLRAIVPIGLMFSLSLICGNLTYLYLSVSFIQMLKATTPVAVLIASWIFGVAPVNFKTLGNVSFIVIGVVIASYGEIQFNMTGFLYQVGGIIFEATRLVMVQRLLSSAEFKMDPLVSLYYFAPACAVMNGLTALVVEVPRLTLADVEKVGYLTLVINAMIAFLLNVSVVFLIGKTSSLVMTLSGVLKDILLVVASIMIFRDPVSGIQAFGYSIALGGLVYYKLGADKLKEHMGGAQRAWADYGAKHPALRKLIVFGLALITIFILLGGISSSGYAPDGYDAGTLAGAASDRLAKGWAGKTNGS
ncbi:Putative sugar phosphate transporter domain-containing protein [Septoria linicola]|uniref:Sugar phosphate transporter domain-containing protein n=1 Tax=Septoria linicola TaxID=215465 RepID=A0A9Q9B1W4_9PEZI|nr:Putative sugar phosphate transporter domain-containing protein [Septoria linicola]